MKKYFPKADIISGIAFFLLSILLTWLTGIDSPLFMFFIEHHNLMNFWTLLNVFPIILGVMFSGNVHQPDLIGMLVGQFLQWFIVGFLLSKIARKIFTKKNTEAKTQTH